MFPFWLFATGILLFVFFLLDRRIGKESRKENVETPGEEATGGLRIGGAVNFLFLFMVVAAFFLPALAREAVMVIATLLSLCLTPGKLRRENRFTYRPIVEVAILFVGIFVTVAPVMRILKESGGVFRIDAGWKFFWASGALSSFLDNAPTYLLFSSVAKGSPFAGGAGALSQAFRSSSSKQSRRGRFLWELSPMSATGLTSS